MSIDKNWLYRSIEKDLYSIIQIKWLSRGTLLICIKNLHVIYNNLKNTVHLKAMYLLHPFLKSIFSYDRSSFPVAVQTGIYELAPVCLPCESNFLCAQCFRLHVYPAGDVLDQCCYRNCLLGGAICHNWIPP